MMQPQIIVQPNPDALARAAAQRIVQRSREAVAARGQFHIALSGGSTPRAVYTLLARLSDVDDVPWDRWRIFWSDERAVPLDDERSNYHMTRATLLDNAPIPAANIFAMDGAATDPDAAARAYEQAIRSIVPGSPPRFDLVLLGLGPDGHTASLFPNSPQLDAGEALVTATPEAPLDPHVRRLTFTPRLINAAAEVLFLVAGADKAARVRDVIEGPRHPYELPAQFVAPQSGILVWMLDQAAAEELHRG